MTVHQYAEWSLAATPAYDRDEYLRNKKEFLMKFKMRGAPPNRPQPGEGAPASDSIPDDK